MMLFVLLLLLFSSVISIISTSPNDKRSRFIFVDPLNEYGSTEVVLQRCKDYNVDCIPMYSPTTAKNLINNLINNVDDDETIEEKIRNIKESTYPNDGQDISTWLSNNWKKRVSSSDYEPIVDNDDSSNVNSEDIIGVLCESDCGLRVSELASSELKLPSSNGIYEGRRDK